MYFPLIAAPGEYLVVLPGANNLRVIDQGGRSVIRRSHFPEGALWTALAALDEDGVIGHLYGLPVARLRALPDLDESPRQALRVVR